jgi:hypothetical protein
MYWSHLEEDRDQWEVLVNVAVSFHIPLNAGTFMTS